MSEKKDFNFKVSLEVAQGEISKKATMEGCFLTGGIEQSILEMKFISTCLNKLLKDDVITQDDAIMPIKITISGMDFGSGGGGGGNTHT